MGFLPPHHIRSGSLRQPRDILRYSTLVLMKSLLKQQVGRNQLEFCHLQLNMINNPPASYDHGISRNDHPPGTSWQFNRTLVTSNQKFSSLIWCRLLENPQTAYNIKQETPKENSSIKKVIHGGEQRLMFMQNKHTSAVSNTKNKGCSQNQSIFVKSL